MHISVLLHECLEVLDPKPGEFFIDGTLGAGGHASALLRRLEPGGTFLGMDWDVAAINALGAELSSNFPRMQKVITVAGNYATIIDRIAEHSLPRANGLLLDLGFSSNQLEGATAGRGFSFSADEPLMMTYSNEATPVSEILATISEAALRALIFEYGQERNAPLIASAIVGARAKGPITTSGQLARIIERAMPRRGRLHPATKTFMALRIYANAELENLKKILGDLPRIMARGGRVAIISFHSLEDRMVKHAFSALKKNGAATLINKKPITATQAEILQNPRARSAKLRALTFTQ